jgi:CBS domain containing-hemolysin-like protein
VGTLSWLTVALLGVCLALIVFAAAAEAGLITISRARVRLLAGQGVPRAERLQSYIQEREGLLLAIRLAHNLAIVTAAALAVSIVVRESSDDWWHVAAVVAGSVAVLTLIEALPRAIVARNPEPWGLRLAPFIGLFKLLFGGLGHLLALPERAMGRGDPDEEEEMLRLVELEEDEGSLEEDERQMIRGVFGLDETTAREIMTPRTDIVAVEVDQTAQEALKLIIDQGYSRLPLYEDHADKVVGVIYAKDLIRYLVEGKLPERLSDIARPAIFVPDSKRVDDLLTEMRKQRVHMAIVVDEYGGTAGLVTIEDILEEIVGEIEDEYDRSESQLVRISDKEAVVDGRLDIDTLNEAFHVGISAENFDTVAGCVYHLLGRMPAVGDEAVTDGLRLYVLAVDGHRIKHVRVTVEEPPAGEDEDARAGTAENDLAQA